MLFQFLRLLLLAAKFVTEDSEQNLWGRTLAKRFGFSECRRRRAQDWEWCGSQNPYLRMLLILEWDQNLYEQIFHVDHLHYHQSSSINSSIFLFFLLNILYENYCGSNLSAIFHAKIIFACQWIMQKRFVQRENPICMGYFCCCFFMLVSKTFLKLHCKATYPPTCH